MGLLPLPSHIHYELLLQLLERQTLPALGTASPHYVQGQQVVIHLRKALALQKQLESSCNTQGFTVEHRWSLNNTNLPTAEIPEHT
jgi:hypothetical protein